MDNYYYQKSVLITGGVGSIGSEIARQVLKHNPKSLTIIDNNETGLFDIKNELNSESVQVFVGDIRDAERMRTLLTGVDVVFHAAALKHVPLCEFNPYEAVKTNIVGTQNVLDAAIINDVKKVIMISTDKAVDPINTMGASKYLAERLTINANLHKKNKNTVFSVVRFGNVLNSRGSIIPIFMQQLESDTPLTITDPEMTRFVMTIPEAANLVLKAGEISQGSEIFILKMPVLKIIDLAKVMIRKIGPKYSFSKTSDPIKIIGTRVGEKLYEELMTEQESDFAYENKEMYVVYPPYLYNLERNTRFLSSGNFVPVPHGEFSSKTARCVNENEIEIYLQAVLAESGGTD